MKPAFGATVSRLANQIARGAAAAGEAVPAGAAEVVAGAPHRLHLGEPISDWDDVGDDELAAIGADRNQSAPTRTRALISRARRGLEVDRDDAVEVLHHTIGLDITFDGGPTSAERAGFGVGGQRRAHRDGETPALWEELFDHLDLPAQVAAAAGRPHITYPQVGLLAGKALTVDQVLQVSADPFGWVRLVEQDTTVDGGWIAHIGAFPHEMGPAVALAGLCCGETLDGATAAAAFAQLDDTDVHDAPWWPLLCWLCDTAGWGDPPGRLDDGAAAVLAKHDQLELRAVAAAYGTLEPDQLAALAADIACDFDRGGRAAHRWAELAPAVFAQPLDPASLEALASRFPHSAHLALRANEVDDATLAVVLAHGGLLHWLAGNLDANPFHAAQLETVWAAAGGTFNIEVNDDPHTWGQIGRDPLTELLRCAPRQAVAAMGAHPTPATQAVLYATIGHMTAAELADICNPMLG